MKIVPWRTELKYPPATREVTNFSQYPENRKSIRRKKIRQKIKHQKNWEDWEEGKKNLEKNWTNVSYLYTKNFRPSEERRRYIDTPEYSAASTREENWERERKVKWKAKKEKERESIWKIDK